MSKPKKVKVRLLVADGSEGERAAYRMVDDLINGSHEDLRPARIALAYNLAWTPDVDGRMTLGKCKRASDLDREFSEFDFVILLNADFWQSADVTDDQRRALLDHELSHAAPALDAKTGEPLEDSRGRRVWRTRKHDIEEFSGVVARHGCYKRDLERFAQALQVGKRAQGSLFAGAVSLTADGTTVAFGSGREFVEACDKVATEAGRPS